MKKILVKVLSTLSLKHVIAEDNHFPHMSWAHVTFISMLEKCILLELLPLCIPVITRVLYTNIPGLNDKLGALRHCEEQPVSFT